MIGVNMAWLCAVSYPIVHQLIDLEGPDITSNLENVYNSQWLSLVLVLWLYVRVEFLAIAGSTHLLVQVSQPIVASGLAASLIQKYSRSFFLFELVVNVASLLDVEILVSK